MDFGTAVHSACERFLKTQVMDVQVAIDKLRELWDKNKHKEDIDTSIEQARAILPELPFYLDEKFPGWECVDAEHALYEPIEGKAQAFKGFVDCIIKVPGKKKTTYWVIDFKSCMWGWPSEKRQDKIVQSQVVLYKNYWAKKAGIDPNDVKAAFLLLKRTGKDGQRCELVPVSATDLMTGRALKVVNNMVTSVKRGITLKNRNSCKYCDYYQTEWCR